MSVNHRLVEACKKGESKAQQLVYDALAPNMMGVCLRYTRNRELAEDLLQESFLTVFTKIEQFQDKGSFEGWVKRIVVNTALMHYRKHHKNSAATISGEDARTESIPDDTAFQEETEAVNPQERIERADFSQEEILEVIQQLPDGFRMVFNLAVLEGYKHKEVAELLAISESTSKTQLLRARKLIQKRLLERAEQKEKKKREWRIIPILILPMSDELNYIDQLVKNNLTDLSVPPATDWSSIAEGLSEAQSASIGGASSGSSVIGANSSGLLSQLGGSLGQWVGGHLSWIIGTALISVVGGGLFFATRGEIAKQPVEPPAAVVGDTLPESNAFVSDSSWKVNEREGSKVRSEATETINLEDPLQSEVDATVYDTVKVIVHEQVIVPQTVKKTIVKRKIRNQSADTTAH